MNEVSNRSGREAGLRPGEFWALDDVSFDLERGKSLAVIGPNGAGKSTLLKVLYGLVKPDRGEVRISGNVTAIIELGTGFHPLLTGRENLRLGAALHGFSRKEKSALYERVIDFAELGDLIDAPLQSYSTGMKARLAYSLAAHLEPDLLLVDEAIAVGDMAFQRKCAAHMRSFLDRGGALVLVSHSTYQVQSLCERGILLDQGHLIFEGSAVETLTRLFEIRPEQLPAARNASSSDSVRIDEVLAEPLDAGVVETGKPLRLTVRYCAAAPAEVVWGFGIWTADQWVCVTGEFTSVPRTIATGPGELTCVIPRVPLVGGRYALRVGILEASTQLPLALYGWYDAPAVLDVRSAPTPNSNSKMTLNQLVLIDVDWE